MIRNLQKEIPILTAQIRALYGELDREYHLQGARVPITFGYEKDLLGSYTRDGDGGKINHPKFGIGSIEKIEQLSGSVRLHIRFKEELKIIDQKWLLRMKYRKSGNWIRS